MIVVVDAFFTASVAWDPSRCVYIIGIHIYLVKMVVVVDAFFIASVAWETSRCVYIREINTIC